jgi:hypothetical protein
MQFRSSNTTSGYRKIALGIALAFGMDGGEVMAQSTSGSIYGTADADAEVTAINEGNGATRTVTVNQSGTFQFNALLPGKYQVKLTEGGKTTTQEVTVLAGQGVNVNLASAAVASAASANAKNLDTISVSANSLANIDVSSVQTNTVITAEQMKSLPIPRC